MDATNRPTSNGCEAVESRRSHDREISKFIAIGLLSERVDQLCARPRLGTPFAVLKSRLYLPKCQ